MESSLSASVLDMPRVALRSLDTPRVALRSRDPNTPQNPRQPLSVKGKWVAPPSPSTGHSSSSSSSAWSVDPIYTPTGGLPIDDNWEVEVSNLREQLQGVSNKLGSSRTTLKRRMDNIKYNAERLAKHVNCQMKEIRRISANSDANFTDAAEDRKDAFAKLVLLEEMMRRQEERMENMEERMGRQEEKMDRLLRHFHVADQPSHSFDDGKDGVLVLQVKLPGLSSMSGVELDVSADGFALSSPLFALELAWPRAVDADGAKAKFLRKSGVLQVTLPLN